jgi:hypothetical protein
LARLGISRQVDGHSNHQGTRTELPDKASNSLQIDGSGIIDLMEPLMIAMRAAAVMPSLPAALQRHIKKRVAPSALSKYLSFDRAIQLAELELETIYIRINQYRMIEAYPRHFRRPIMT